ncbi:DNA cytosine methyltransferase [Pseudokineococcus basanitobsidens]|uniref:Cytosine-specific methyltransferase n=1 Tax=Pseudokineococcus basanitobsidens TaxID=1926649 RepID=A0ABU8RNC3_9ACTN
MSVLTAVDLFAGAGGLTLGLQQAGFTVLGAIEVDPLACATYADNHDGVRLWQDDVRHVDGEQLMRGIGLRAGELDLLAGCPPCQGFSTLRTLNGRQAPAEPRNDLVREYGRLVAQLRPRAVLMENVPGLAKDERMDELVELLEGLGYPARSGTRIMNAADYGVPQSRRRLVLTAARHAVLEPAVRTPARPTVRQAISRLPPAGSSGDPLHDLPERRSARVADLIRQVPVDGGSRSALREQLSCHARVDGFKDVYGRMSWDRPAPTITGGCHNPSKGRFLHPDQHRAVTLREAALLQGFPPRYAFRLGRGKLAAALMIGNAIPPAFVAAHALPIAAALRSSHAAGTPTPSLDG